MAEMIRRRRLDLGYRYSPGNAFSPDQTFDNENPPGGHLSPSPTSLRQAPQRAAPLAAPPVTSPAPRPVVPQQPTYLPQQEVGRELRGLAGRGRAGPSPYPKGFELLSDAPKFRPGGMMSGVPRITNIPSTRQPSLVDQIPQDTQEYRDSVPALRNSPAQAPSALQGMAPQAAQRSPSVRPVTPKAPKPLASAPASALAANTPDSRFDVFPANSKQGMDIAGQVARNQYMPEKGGGVVISPNGQVTRINPSQQEEPIQQTNYGSAPMTLAGSALALAFKNSENNARIRAEREGAANAFKREELDLKRANLDIDRQRIGIEGSRADREKARDNIYVSPSREVMDENGQPTTIPPRFFDMRSGKEIGKQGPTEDEFLAEKMSNPKIKGMPDAEAKVRKMYRKMNEGR